MKIVYPNNPGYLSNQFAQAKPEASPELIENLLCEINRVKVLVNQYSQQPSHGDYKGIGLFNELIAEAYQSLINYDVPLMKKYYDLLQTCD
jgi:hypothetical protein